MGAALGLIGLGVSAISTVTGLSSASSSARAQKQAIADQEMLSQDRLELYKENFKFSQEWAAENAKSELATLRAQKAQSMQAITEQVLNNRAAITQARLAAASVRADTTQAVSRLLGDAANAQAETSVNNANTLEAGVGMIRDAQGDVAKSSASQSGNETVSSQSFSGSADQQRYAQAVIEQLTRLQENVLSSDAAANRNTDSSRKGAAIQQNIGDLQSGYQDATTDIQQQSNALYKPFAKKQVNASYKRNQLGILAKNYSSAASASAQLAAQVAGERSTQSQLAAQKSQIQSPGFLSYLSGAANIASQGYQMGLFRFGGGQPNSPVNPGSAVGNFANGAYGTPTGQGQRNYVMPTTSQLKGISNFVAPRRTTPTYQQYTDVTGNTYG